MSNRLCRVRVACDTRSAGGAGTYAARFATVSLAWTHVTSGIRDWRPVAGPLTMAAALLGRVVAAGGSWPLAVTIPSVLCAGAGHAAAFSRISNRTLAATGLGFITDECTGRNRALVRIAEVAGAARHVANRRPRRPFG